jgi:sulfatase maturation enzyme AslB (radical SAM superfamily)
MLTGIHFLLSYTCTMECDHCFLYCKPNAGGTFTIEQIRKVLDQAKEIGTVTSVFFEGGEPFMFYPLLLEGVRLSRETGLEVGLVTNSYFATTVEDAKLWLRPLKDQGVSKVHISDDTYHHEKNDPSPGNVAKAAEDLGMQINMISIDEPEPDGAGSELSEEGAVVGGGPLMKGRAVEKVSKDLPLQPFGSFRECKDEELRSPKRVHIDSYGNVHICQGISMGNMWETPLSKLVKEYDPEAHPIIGPLLEGGPARLIEKYGIEHEDRYVSACHCCYMARLALIDRFPGFLAPRQVYGLD